MEQELETLLEKYEFNNTILILPKNIKLKKNNQENLDQTQSKNLINLLKEFEDDIENNKITIITQSKYNDTTPCINHKNLNKTKTRFKNRFKSKNQSKIKKSNRLLISNELQETNLDNKTNLEIESELKTFINLLKKTIKENILKKNNNCVLENNKHIISSISHQFKTPINGLTTGVYVLENYLNNDFFKKILKHLLNCCLDLNIFINDIIDYHLLKTSNIKYNYSNIDLPEILKSLEEYYKEELFLKKIKFEKTNQVNQKINSDPVRIKQILRYLLSNSIKHSNDSLIELKIELDNNDRIVFTIIDEGPGIPESEKEKVFEPFYQIDCENNKWMTTQEGLGLGLTNSRFLTKQLGGEIYFISNQNKTMIQFYIKNKIKNKTNNNENQNNDLKVNNNSITKATENNYNDFNLDKLDKLNKLNKLERQILIIEDNVMNAQLIKLMINNILGNSNHIKNNINLVTDSEKSISKLINQDYNLVFLDLKMPNLSGFQILDLIESNQKLKEKYNSKIIIITALANNIEVSMLKKYTTVLDIIFKPLEISSINKIIQDFLINI